MAAEAQKARLDALEQRLNSLQAASPPVAPVPANGPAAAEGVTSPPSGPAATTPQSGLNYAQGQGLTFATPTTFVQLYGLIDVSYVHINSADAAGDNLSTARVAWFSGNRWGLTGRRAMGDSGLNVIFKLESEFESQTGSLDTPNVLFNRDAWVGVENGTIGKLTFGRQYALARDPTASGIYGDPYGPAAPTTDEGGYTNNNNFKQLIFYAGSATGTRVDNGIVWKKAFSNGLVAGVQYQFGGVAGDFPRGASETVSLAYAGGPFNVAGFVTSADVAGLKNRTYSIGGNAT